MWLDLIGSDLINGKGSLGTRSPRLLYGGNLTPVQDEECPWRGCSFGKTGHRSEDLNVPCRPPHEQDKVLWPCVVEVINSLINEVKLESRRSQGVSQSPITRDVGLREWGTYKTIVGATVLSLLWSRRRGDSVWGVPSESTQYSLYGDRIGVIGLQELLKLLRRDEVMVHQWTCGTVFGTVTKRGNCVKSKWTQSL